MATKYILCGEDITSTPTTMGVHTGETESRVLDIPLDADTLGGRYDADDIEAISDSLANLNNWETVQISSVTPTNCTIQDGSYIRVNRGLKLCTFSIVVQISAWSAYSNYITGMPTPLFEMPLSAFNGSASRIASFNVAGEGNIKAINVVSGTPVSGDYIRIGGTYLYTD